MIQERIYAIAKIYWHTKKLIRRCNKQIFTNYYLAWTYSFINKMLQKYESNNIWLWLFGLRTSWLIYSIPNVDVSSTASSSFSSNTSGDGYGGRSKRLKHVWALKKLFVVVIYHIGHNLLGKIQQNKYLYSWKIILPGQAYSFTPLFNAKFPWSIWSPQRRKSFIGYWRSAGYKL